MKHTPDLAAVVSGNSKQEEPEPQPLLHGKGKVTKEKNGAMTSLLTLFTSVLAAGGTTGSRTTVAEGSDDPSSSTSPAEELRF